ncbi:MAG: site-specific integrase, partial [Jatrophihabitans sp.]|uniref:site-specific integrase n=1 Tax=Jatrophihabitans sp. TaxID=1932789 RepID=UPI003F7CF7B3
MVDDAMPDGAAPADAMPEGAAPTGAMRDGAAPTAARFDVRAARAALPRRLAEAVDGFERHLALQRNRSPHTVRAYLGDVVGSLDHLSRLGGMSPQDMDLRNLRSWLALLRTRGASRATLARRSAALRTFSAWA